MHYHVLKNISLQQIVTFLFLIFLSEIRWLNIFVNAQHLDNDWENTLSTETSSLDPSVTNITNIDSFSVLQNEKDGIFATHDQEKYTISTQTDEKDENESRETIVDFRIPRQSNLAENSENDSNNSQYDLDTLASEFRNISDEMLTTTTSNDNDQYENSTNKVSSNKDFSDDINPLVVIDVGDSKKNESLRKTYTFDRRQAGETEVGNKVEVVHFSPLHHNDIKENRFKEFSNKKLKSDRLNKKNKDNNNINTGMINNFKSPFPLPEINENEKANKKSDSMKREIYPFNDKNIDESDINFLTNENLRKEIPNKYQNPEWMLQKNLLTRNSNNNNIYENQNKYGDDTYNQDRRLSNMEYNPDVNQNIRDYENIRIPNYVKSFPDVSNFIQKDYFDNAPNKLTKILSVKQTYLINKNGAKEPKESKNIYKNIYPYETRSINSNLIRNNPEKLKEDTLAENSHFEIKPQDNSFEIANKNPNSQMHSSIFKMGKNNPHSKLIIRREEEKTEHINENVNKNAEIMHIKPPPAHFEEFIRPELLETATKEKEFSTYNAKQTNERVNGILDNIGNKSSFNKHQKLSKSKINIPIKTITGLYPEHWSAHFDENNNINKSKTGNSLINKSRETDNIYLFNKPNHAKNKQGKNGKLKLRERAKTIRNQISKVNLQKMPTISHVRYRNDYSTTPYSEKKRKAFGKNAPNYSMRENYVQENRHLLNKDLVYKVPPVDSDQYLRKFPNDKTMYDTNLIQSDEPYGRKFNNEMSSSLSEPVTHKLDKNERGSYSSYVEYTEQPTVQGLTKTVLNDMSSYLHVKPKLKPEGLKNRREYSAQGEQKPVYYIDNEGIVQTLKPDKNEENIYPQFSLGRDLQTTTYHISERYPTYNEKNFALKTRDKLENFKDFDRIIAKNDDKINSDLEQVFQPDIDELPAFRTEKQSSHLNIRPALGANEKTQNEEMPLSNRKQYDYFQEMQTQRPLVNIPQNKISVNKVYSPNAMQSQLRVHIPPLENLAETRPIDEDLDEFDEVSFNNYGKDVLKKPRFDNHGSKIESEISIPNEMEIPDNKNTAKEIKTINKKIETESIQIEKQIPLSNKDSATSEDGLMLNNEHNFNDLKNVKETDDLLDDGNPHQSSYSSTNEPEYEFNTENLNKAYAEFQKDLNKMKPYTDYSSDISEQTEVEFDSLNSIKNIQNKYANPHQSSYFSTNDPEFEFNTENLNKAYAEFQKDLNKMKPYTDYSSDISEQTEAEFDSLNSIKNIKNNYLNQHLPLAQKIRLGLNKEDSLFTTSSEEKFEADLSNPKIAAVEYSDLYLLDNGKNNKYMHVKNINQPFRKLVKVSEIEVFSPKKLNETREVINDIDKLARVLRNSEDVKDEANTKLGKAQNTNKNDSYSYSHQFSTKASLEMTISEEPEVEDDKNFTNKDSHFHVNKIRRLFSFPYSQEKDESIKVDNTTSDVFRDTKPSTNERDLIYERTRDNNNKLNETREVIKDIDILEGVLRNSEDAKDKVNAKLTKTQNTNENKSYSYSHQFSTKGSLEMTISEEQNFYGEQLEVENDKNFTNNDSHFHANKIRRLFSFTYSQEKEESIKIDNTTSDIFSDTKPAKNEIDFIYVRITDNNNKLNETREVIKDMRNSEGAKLAKTQNTNENKSYSYSHQFSTKASLETTISEEQNFYGEQLDVENDKNFTNNDSYFHANKMRRLFSFTYSQEKEESIKIDNTTSDIFRDTKPAKNETDFIYVRIKDNNNKLNETREVSKDIDKLELILRNSEDAKDEVNTKLNKIQNPNENKSYSYSHQFSTKASLETTISEEQNFYDEQLEVENDKNFTTNDSYFHANKIRRLFSFTYSQEKDESIKIDNTTSDILRDTKPSENETDLIYARTKDNYNKLNMKIWSFINYIVELAVEFMRILAIATPYIFIAMLIILLVFISNRFVMLYCSKYRRRCHVYNIDAEV